MEILQIAALGVVSTVAVLILRGQRPELAIVLGIGAGVLVLISILDSLYEVVYAFYSLAETAALDNDIFVSLLKVIGVGYVTEFSASICSDAGNKSVGDKIMLAGKVTIMLLALPVIKALLLVVAEVMP